MTFWGTHFFKSAVGQPVDLGQSIVYPIFRQVDEEEVEIVEEVQTVTTATMSTVGSFMIFVIGIGGRDLPTWMFYNSLSLILHTPLLPTNMPTNLHIFLIDYLNFIRFKIESVEQQIEQWQLKYGLIDIKSASTDDSTWSALLKSCGYGSEFTRNLFLVIWISIALTILMAMAAVLDIVTKRSGKRSLFRFAANFNLRFAYMLFFEFFLCSMLHLTSQQNAVFGHSSMANFVQVVVVATLILLSLFVCFVFSRFFVNGPYVNDSYAEKSLIQSYWSLRPLSNRTVKRLNKPLSTKQDCESYPAFTEKKRGIDNIFGVGNEDDEESQDTGRQLLKVNDCAAVDFN